MFTIQTLNNDYKQYYGYDCSNRKFANSSDVIIQCTKLETTKKENGRENGHNNNQAITELPRVQISMVEQDDKEIQDQLSDNLNTGMINMLKNTRKMDPPTLNKFLHLYQLYGASLDDIESTKMVEQRALKRSLLPITTPNYPVDDMYRRRGTRKRKKTTILGEWIRPRIPARSNGKSNYTERSDGQDSDMERNDMDEMLTSEEEIEHEQT